MSLQTIFELQCFDRLMLEQLPLCKDDNWSLGAIYGVLYEFLKQGHIS
jgi:hypothetical protein